MTVLRTLLITMLLVALLPWGAYLRAFSVQAGSGAPMATSSAAAQRGNAYVALSDTVQKSTWKCRKGLPGSTCFPDAKAILSHDGWDAPVPPRMTLLIRKELLPEGTRARPALPPPRPI